jgi:hypothetical protein
VGYVGITPPTYVASTRGGDDIQPNKKAMAHHYLGLFDNKKIL